MNIPHEINQWRIARREDTTEYYAKKHDARLTKMIFNKLDDELLFDEIYMMLEDKANVTEEDVMEAVISCYENIGITMY